MAKGAVHTSHVTPRQVIVFLLLLTAIAATGLAIVEGSQRTRGLYQTLGDVQQQQDKLLEEQSRLSIERGAFSSLSVVEEIAASELDMVFPAAIERVVP